LAFQGTGLQALGYGLLAIILSVLIIPAAWGAVAFYRWFVRNLSFSDGTEASFTGRGGEIWRTFALAMIISYIPHFFSRMEDPEATSLVPIFLPLALLPISAAIWLRIVRWFVAKISLSCGTSLSFVGAYGPYLGWTLLLALSFFTIIGWAWAAVAMTRWLCRNVEGGQHRVVFEGGGWALLWRGTVAALASIIVIPIPWMATWIVRWFARNMVIQRTAV
jgi:hypothetical protein